MNQYQREWRPLFAYKEVTPNIENHLKSFFIPLWSIKCLLPRQGRFFLARYYAFILISIKFSSSLDQSQHSSSIRLEMTSHRNELILTVQTKNSLAANRYIYIQRLLDTEQIELQQNFFLLEKHNRITYQRKVVTYYFFGYFGSNIGFLGDIPI